MQRGFTIWEAFVALALMIMVAVIVFPLFTPARNPIRYTCLTPEKQLGLALFQYSDNNDGRLPPMSHDQKNTWRVAVYSQLKSNDVYKCPEDDRPPGPDGHFPSYAMNVGAALPRPGAEAKPLHSVSNPSNLILLCEVQNTGYACFDIDDAIRFLPDKHVLAIRHFGGSNYLFADGHTRWFRPSAFLTASPATGMPPAPWHRDPHYPLSKNALAVLADTQARAK